MADYYVAKTGNDTTGDGSELTPWLTIGHGITHSGHALTGGDTLYIKAGTYSETINNTIPAGTSWANAVTLSAFEEDVVTINGGGGSAFHLVLISSAASKYIQLLNLVLDASNVTTNALKITGAAGNAATYIRAQNCEFKNADSSAILVTTDCDFCEILDCDIHTNGQVLGGTGKWPHAVYHQGSNGLYEGCEIYSNKGTGIQIYEDASKDCNDNIIRKCSIHDNGTAGETRGGIILGNGNRSLVYNNLIYDNIGTWAILINVGPHYLYNNTLYNNGGDAVLIGPTYSNGNIIRNNIFWQNGTDGVEIGAGSSATDSNNITADPNFVSTTPADPDFLKIDASSTAVLDVGYDLRGTVDDDFIGTARPQNLIYDVGAYEYITAIPDEAPINSITNQSVIQNVASVLSGISVSDVNADCLTLWFKLEGGKGTLAGSTVDTAVGTFV
jgi:hypothetical protein